MLTPSDVALVLLAAGAGRRFGADKLLHEVAGEPLGLRSARIYAGLGFAARIAVCRPGHPLAGPLTALGFQIAENTAAETGMGSSLAVGVGAALARRPAAILVALADMPFVMPAHVQALLCAFHGGLLASTGGGATSPPALFGPQYHPALLAATGDSGARDLLRGAPALRVDGAMLRDIDTPTDV